MIRFDSEKYIHADFFNTKVELWQVALWDSKMNQDVCSMRPGHGMEYIME